MSAAAVAIPRKALPRARRGVGCSRRWRARARSAGGRVMPGCWPVSWRVCLRVCLRVALWGKLEAVTAVASRSSVSCSPASRAPASRSRSNWAKARLASPRVPLSAVVGVRRARQCLDFGHKPWLSNSPSGAQLIQQPRASEGGGCRGTACRALSHFTLDSNTHPPPPPPPPTRHTPHPTPTPRHCGPAPAMTARCLSRQQGQAQGLALKPPLPK